VVMQRNPRTRGFMIMGSLILAVERIRGDPLHLTGRTRNDWQV
jgi:hypothetical protein